MGSKDLMEWFERRLIRLGGALSRPLESDRIEELEIPVHVPVTKFTPTGARIRTTAKMKKLKCGHLYPRRKGVYPRRCPDCEKSFNERVSLMRRTMK